MNPFNSLTSVAWLRSTAPSRKALLSWVRHHSVKFENRADVRGLQMRFGAIDLEPRESTSYVV